MDKTNNYKTLSKPSEEVLYKDKKSKFYGYAFPINKKGEVRPLIEHLQKKHPTANHVCYAWQLGVNTIEYRTNDHGEPNNSAGMPIYGQIQSFGVTNVLIAVVRIFGGTKLGVGGLIGAYRTTAKMSLEAAVIIELALTQELWVSFNYGDMNKVMRIVKRNQLEINSQKMEENCLFLLTVRKQSIKKVEEAFLILRNVKVQKQAN